MSSEFRRGDENRPKPRISVSTRLNGTHPTPAPSLRELLSAAKLRECTPMNVTTQKFQSSYAPVCKSSARWNHRTTLPQSRFRSTAPSEREPGGAGAIHRAGGKPGRWRAIFIAPTKALVILPFSIHPTARKPGRWRAIFIAPTEGVFHSTCCSGNGFPPQIGGIYTLISTSPEMPGTRPSLVYCHISTRKGKVIRSWYRASQKG